jgi:hypothetical protein
LDEIEDTDGPRKCTLDITTYVIKDKIRKHLRSDGPVDLTSPHATHIEVVASNGQVDAEERQYQGLVARSMAENAESMNFPDVAADFYRQALDIRIELHDDGISEFLFKDRAPLEARYVRVLMVCHQLCNTSEAAEQLDLFVEHIQHYSDQRSPDTIALRDARREAGMLLLDGGRPEDAVVVLRDALFTMITTHHGMIKLRC